MKSHELALVYKSDPTERNVLDPYDKNSRYSEKQKTGVKITIARGVQFNNIHNEVLVSAPNRPAAIAQ
ncbi:hypothetical protein C1646_768095 [Rhizophagus diaphanus]|nr:hypothetical protein C1646_768095 [Rhizophagus diaphanus] [Rhizophagus sp. MUCL 43196]